MSSPTSDRQISLLPQSEEKKKVPPPLRKNDDLTRQVRNLLLLLPVTRLELDKLRLGPENLMIFKGIDTNFLSYSMFDYISESMIFESGATREGIIEHLKDEAKRLKPNIPDTEGEIIGEILLDQLCNSRENHKAFQFEYFDALEDKMKVRQFRLIFYKVGDDNEGRYFLTNEGFAAYLSMLELDTRMGQEVDEFLIQRLMERGSYGDALRISKRNRKRTIELKDTLSRKLFKIGRDVQSVDWSDEVRPYLDQSRSHIKGRIEQEGRILAKIGEILEQPDVNHRDDLIHLQETIDECQGEHRKLHSQLMGFNEQFLDLQIRAFRTPRISGNASLEDEILMKLLDSGIDKMGQRAVEITTFMNHPKVNSLFDPLLLISFIDSADGEYEEELQESPGEMEGFVDSMERFDNKMIVEMGSWLEKVVADKKDTDLSQIIRKAESDHLNSIEILCLV
ncbi:MAG: hypothetical protein GY786_24755, partial [Proteobacteria bacterium]|nr:hypothetical protein [Pseudomonadota bacterium]